MHIPEGLREKRLKDLAESKGLSVDELIEQSVTDSISPAICLDCGLATEMEPDQDAGYCESCGTNTVVAALVLARLI